MVLVGIYLFACVLGRLSARHFLYAGLGHPRAFSIEGVTLLELRGADDNIVHVAFAPAPEGATTIAFFHGNGEQIGDHAWLMHELMRRGFGVAFLEYRGYGVSTSQSVSEEGIYRDAETMFAELYRRGIDKDHVTLVGSSLGTGIAAEMAKRGRAKSLVLISPYTSIPDIAHDWLPFLPVSLLIPDHFDTLSKAADIHVPTLIIHGDQDGLIDFAMGKTLSERIAGARLLPVAGGHHGDLFHLDGPELLREIEAQAQLPASHLRFGVNSQNEMLTEPHQPADAPWPLVVVG